MNPAQLLAHFDRISEAPDAIPRLRRFILDLAVRGKLVEQDPRDEPASELLKRIEAERVQLNEKQGSIVQLEPDEIWPVPADWVFVPLEMLAMPAGLFTDGDWVESKDQDPSGDVRLTQLADVGTGEFRNRSSRFMNAVTAARLNCTFLNKGDILIARMPDPIGRACIFLGDPKPCVTVVDVAVLRLGSQDFDAAYVVHAINSSQFSKNVQSKAAGTTRSRISRGNLSMLPFPLPPLAEQHRIVAKVDELMALCDRLEATQMEREGRRDRLAAATLHRLNNGADADAFRNHARFALDHLPRLTTRSEHIQQLRQTILNLAVRGRLVPQDPNDEPASELLKRIQAEKVLLVKEGKIKKFDPIEPPCNSDFPLVRPSGWTAANLQSVCISVTDGDHQPPPQADHGIPFLVIGNVRSQTMDFVGCRYVSEQYYKALDSIRRPRKGDVLYTLVGSYGIPIMVTDDRPFCVQRHIGILRPSTAINTSFIGHVLESQWVFDQATACATGIAQKTVPLSGLRRIQIPLPPLAEQHRIVAKVDELMALCDRLEAQLTTTQTESRRLLEAILHQAITTA